MHVPACISACISAVVEPYSVIILHGACHAASDQLVSCASVAWRSKGLDSLASPRRLPSESADPKVYKLPTCRLRCLLILSLVILMKPVDPALCFFMLQMQWVHVKTSQDAKGLAILGSKSAAHLDCSFCHADLVHCIGSRWLVLCVHVFSQSKSSETRQVLAAARQGLVCRSLLD